MAAVLRSRFYAGVALLFAALVFAGFARTYYLWAWFDVPAITLLLHLHSIVFTAWFLLFIVQTRLIVARNYHTHMRLGIAGLMLAALVVALGLVTAVLSASAVRPRPMGMNSAQFVFAPMVGILSFAGFVAAAAKLRRNAMWHKRLMTLAMIAVLGPPVARLIALVQAGDHFLAIQTSVAAVMVGICLANDWRQSRPLRPAYAVPGTLLVLSWPLRAAIARTAGWERVGQWLATLI